MNFGEWVRRELQNENKDIAWLAKQTNINISVISRWRKNYTSPQIQNYLLVCMVIAKIKNEKLINVIVETAKILGVEIERD